MAITNTGKASERMIIDALKAIDVTYFDWQRMYDATSARGAFMAQTGDIQFFLPGVHGVLEIKSTNHASRLQKRAFSDLQRGKLRKRMDAGGKVFVAVHHYMAGVWRLVPYDACHEAFDLEQQASLDLSELPCYERATQVVAAMIEEVLK